MIFYFDVELTSHSGTVEYHSGNRLEWISEQTFAIYDDDSGVLFVDMTEYSDVDIQINSE